MNVETKKVCVAYMCLKPWDTYVVEAMGITKGEYI